MSLMFLVVFSVGSIIFGSSVFYKLKKGYIDEGWIPGGIVVMIIGLLFLGGAVDLYFDSKLIADEIGLVQKEAMDAIEDGAGDVERSKIREKMLEVNRKLFDYQLDNRTWIWDLQISDVVDDVQPARFKR